MPEPGHHEPTTIGGFDTGGRVFVLALFGAGGLLLGWAFPYVAGWAAELPWVPFQGPLRLLGSFDDTWLTWGRPVIGLVLGLVLALFTFHESPLLTIADEQIEVRSGDDTTVIHRDQVDGVRHTSGKVVILNATGRELFAGEVEGGREEIREAFVRHGYPWESA